MDIQLCRCPYICLVVLDAHPHALSNFFIGKLIKDAIAANNYKVALVRLEAEGANLGNGDNHLGVAANS